MLLPNKLQEKSSEPTKKSQIDQISVNNDQVELNNNNSYKTLYDGYTKSEKDVLNYASCLSNQSPTLRMTRKQIADKIGIHEDTVGKIITKLEGDGWWKKQWVAKKQCIQFSFNPMFYTTSFRNMFKDLLKGFRYLPLWLLTSSLFTNSCLCEYVGSYIKELKGIKEISLSYCKSIPVGIRLTYREWMSLQRWPSDFLQESIEIYRGLKKKPKNPYAYLMGICRQRAGCFGIEPDAVKIQYLLHSLRESPASHIETQKTKTPKKGTSKRLYKDYGYNLCEYGQIWGKSTKKKTMQKKEEVLTKEQIEWKRRGHSPMVELPQPESLTRDQAITEYKDMKNSSAINAIKDKGLAEILLAFGATTLKNRIDQ